MAVAALQRPPSFTLSLAAETRYGFHLFGKKTGIWLILAFLPISPR